MLFAAPILAATRVLAICIDTGPSLVDHFHACSMSGQFSDVSIVVGSERFQGHRIVLSRWPFFAAAFRNGFSECMNNEIEIHDVPLEAFRVVWRSLYTDDLAFVGRLRCTDVLQETIAAAHRFEMHSLGNTAAYRLAAILDDELMLETVIPFLSHALKDETLCVRDSCLNFIRLQDPDVIKSELQPESSHDSRVHELIVQTIKGKRRRH
eukprot:gnl/TRDRNA2_/TRDRNA2_168511_c0_seq3.p1 gnl/TRDRNA2_/TRDRNA2_168511_c0~~gnl/TRDRNA2_/TRDRNA2_168511_c0_seq3.p1  ORF type:complete len:209 (+),score=15.69 gnl/TRDRNA2_/TRDRNA2_168511_c0_seq3:1-627(+)